MASGDVLEPGCGRLAWMCRRGLKELDVLIQPYLVCGYAASSVEERRCFVRLMGEEDVDLLDWLVYEVTPPEPYQVLIKGIHRYAHSR